MACTVCHAFTDRTVCQKPVDRIIRITATDLKCDSKLFGLFFRILILIFSFFYRCASENINQLLQSVQLFFHILRLFFFLQDPSDREKTSSEAVVYLHFHGKRFLFSYLITDLFIHFFQFSVQKLQFFIIVLDLFSIIVNLRYIDSNGLQVSVE